MNPPQPSEDMQNEICELKDKLSDLTKSVDEYKEKITEFETLLGDNETKKLRFNGLLSEMQNVDQLVENHSRISLVISTGLLAFATTEDVVAVPTWALAALGIFVLIIWVLKIFRHKQIFDYCLIELKELQKDAIRPEPGYSWTHGFTLMYALVFVILVAWIGIGVVALGDKPESTQPNLGSIEEKLSHVGAQLDAALLQVKTVEDNVRQLSTVTKTINMCLEKFNIELPPIKRTI